RLHDVADKSEIPRPARLETRRLVAAPYDAVGGALDVGDLVAVLDRLVTGEIEDARALGPQRRADREQDGVAEPAADQQHGFARWGLGWRTRRAHQDDRLTRLQQRAQIGRSAHFEDDRREQALLAVDPGAGQRQSLHRQGRAV